MTPWLPQFVAFGRSGHFVQTTGSASCAERDVYLTLNTVSALLGECDRRFFAELGLTTRQFWALRHLDERRGRPMIELSRALSTDKGNVTGIVDRLERLGLVARGHAPNDRRTTLVRLTSAGRHMRDEIDEAHEARLRDMLGATDSLRLRELAALLGEIEKRLGSYLGGDAAEVQAAGRALER